MSLRMHLIGAISVLEKHGVGRHLSSVPYKRRTDSSFEETVNTKIRRREIGFAKGSENLK